MPAHIMQSIIHITITTIRMNNYSFFYQIKPLIPRNIQLLLRRYLITYQLKKCQNIWPILPAAGKKPDHWPGWPEDKKFALVLTHDVESQRGHDKALDLMELEKARGFKSSFNFVPEKYEVDSSLRKKLIKNGFEVGVHGLKHDGKLFSSYNIFQCRARKINKYLSEWNSLGFRSPSMHHNLDWLHALNIQYDMSTFDTDPFEPQSDGVETVFPFYVKNKQGNGGYMELPYTLAQDFTLFILMKEKSINKWKEKLDWLVETGGMALINTHPDYMYFGKSRKGAEEFPVELYLEFLAYVKDQYSGQYWNALPCEVAQYGYKNLSTGTSKIFQNET